MRKLFTVLLLTLCLTNTLQAISEASDRFSRIKALLPNLTTPPAVDPYLPDNYILIQNDSLNEYFWGPKELDRTFSENPTLIQKPIIHVTTESGFKSFDKDMKEVLYGMETQYPIGFNADFSHWGGYPLVAIKMQVGLDAVYMAYVSLGDKEGTVLIFHLMYPNKNPFGNNNPSRDDLRFWRNFLELTRRLS